jgi:hypothetical protein
MRQEVPNKLTLEEAMEYSNEMKAHSVWAATLEKHRGQVYLLILGQCNHLLQDKMKQEKAWAQVSVSYKPLDLYKLIESVVLKQTEDQYLVAAVWEQYGVVYNSKQGNLTSTEWYERFNTKVEVAESVGCVFASDKMLTYCSGLEYKLPYSQLTNANKIVVTNLARDRFISYGMLTMSSNTHDKIKSDLSDDFTKGRDNYPTTPQQSLLLLDKYSKKPAVVNHSEGTAFAQGGTKKKMKKNKNDTDPKNVEYHKEFYKDKDCFQCGKKGHPKAACTVKMVPADEAKSTKPASSTKSELSKALLKEVGITLSSINNAFKTIGKALSQVHNEIGTLADDESFKEQSHNQIGMVMCGSKSYSFATSKFSMRNHLLLNNQSSVHVFCNPQFVSNVRSAERQLQPTSNGGNLPILEVADFDEFNKEVWYSEDTITNILPLSLVKR